MWSHSSDFFSPPRHRGGAEHLGEQVTCFKCLDLYHKSLDSAARQYKSRSCKGRFARRRAEDPPLDPWIALQVAGFRQAPVQIQGREKEDLVPLSRCLSPPRHRGRAVHLGEKIIFFNRFDLYHKWPDSGELRYKFRGSKKRS